METWQWTKAPPAVGHSDWHRQNKDTTMCLISRAVTPATMQRADSHIRNDGWITTRELAAVLGVGKGSVDKIIHQLGYWKECARWVPRSLTEEHKEQRKIICSELLARYEAEGDYFLSTIVTGDETWIHHTTSPWKKKFKAIPSASKIMATVFWDCGSESHRRVVQRPNDNSDVYVETLKRRFRRVSPHKNVTTALLHHNARPHASPHTQEAISFSGPSCLTHRTARIWLLPTSIFSVLWKMHPRKEVWGRRGSHFGSKEVVATETCRAAPQRHTCCHILMA
jgi:hypothetical protein